MTGQHNLLKKVTFSNSILVILLVKLMFWPDPIVAVAFACAILNYISLGFIEARHASEISEVKTKEIRSQIARVELELIKNAANIENLSRGFSLVAKQSEDTKKLISTTHLANAFVPRNKRPERQAD